MDCVPTVSPRVEKPGQGMSRVIDGRLFIRPILRKGFELIALQAHHLAFHGLLLPHALASSGWELSPHEAAGPTAFRSTSETQRAKAARVCRNSLKPYGQADGRPIRQAAIGNRLVRSSGSDGKRAHLLYGHHQLNAAVRASFISSFTVSYLSSTKALCGWRLQDCSLVPAVVGCVHSLPHPDGH